MKAQLADSRKYTENLEFLTVFLYFPQFSTAFSVVRLDLCYVRSNSSWSL